MNKITATLDPKDALAVASILTGIEDGLRGTPGHGAARRVRRELSNAIADQLSLDDIKEITASTFH